jgi:hypothetical protein
LAFTWSLLLRKVECEIDSQQRPSLFTSWTVIGSDEMGRLGSVSEPPLPFTWIFALPAFWTPS